MMGICMYIDIVYMQVGVCTSVCVEGNVGMVFAIGIELV